MKALRVVRSQGIARSQRIAERHLAMYRTAGAGQVFVEEETLSHYDALQYYPVHINQTFCNRYKVAAKLGFGGSSTVWLCEDIVDKAFKTLKVGVRRTSESQEVKVVEYLKKTKLPHDGRYCVRRPCDSFDMHVPSGCHHCLVYEPLGMSLLDYVERQQDHRINDGVVKWTMTYLLKAVDYLHSSGVVHTDIKLDNIQNTLPDEETAILTRFVNAEREEPGPRKIVDEARTIYISRPLGYGDIMTFPILSDLGMCVFGQEKYEGVIQPVPYRAPEIILRMKWDRSVDIWNLGVLVWELLFAEHLFGSNNENDNLAMMITYLGPPPSELLEKNEVPELYFNDNGQWKESSLQPISLEDRLERGPDTDVFLDFMRSMLDWVPGKRKTAAELLKHPWLESQ